MIDRALARELAKIVKEHLKDPANRKQFEQWYYNKYHKTYNWGK